ncbi:response regulator transcription factor [Aliamphritea ceti]|uniref:response regulator transcription factor n=1 Tax=Aliamphritea ceti TaxID=1524258 RepID=UPI0021C2AFD1|nr:response regulator transcription factor [Aliamphritea ceti]
MHVFVSKKKLSPVRWHEAFPDALTVRTPQEAQRVHYGSGLIWLDFTSLEPVEKTLWLHAAQELRTPVVVLSNLPNDDEAMMVFRSGSAGYSHVLAAATLLREIALVVEHGGYWVGAEFIGKVLKVSSRYMQVESCEGAVFFDELTAREQMVAQLIAQGASNKEIAGSLGVTERTVKAHVSSIFAKSGARDRVHLVLLLNEHEVFAV